MNRQMLGLKLLSRVHKVLWDLAPDYLSRLLLPNSLFTLNTPKHLVSFVPYTTPFFSMILHNLSVLILNPYHYV